MKQKIDDNQFNLFDAVPETESKKRRRRFSKQLPSVRMSTSLPMDTEQMYIVSAENGKICSHDSTREAWVEETVERYESRGLQCLVMNFEEYWDSYERGELKFNEKLPAISF
jgi:hypothetical protein